MEKLPYVEEVFCFRSDLDCACGFTWSCTAYSIGTLICGLAVIGFYLVYGKQEEERRRKKQEEKRRSYQQMYGLILPHSESSQEAKDNDNSASTVPRTISREVSRFALRTQLSV